MSGSGNRCEASASERDQRPDGAAQLLALRVQQAEAEAARLTLLLKHREQQLGELRMAFAHSATLHYWAQERLERELEMFRAPARTAQGTDEDTGQDTGQDTMPADRREDLQADDAGGVLVRLPYMTTVLTVLIDTMRTYWAGCDRDSAPKSSTVARALDERLNLRSQADGNASRSAQAYAAAIRPDWVKEDDHRHHRRCLRHAVTCAGVGTADGACTGTPRAVPLCAGIAACEGERGSRGAP